jgi:hypothetical protein
MMEKKYDAQFKVVFDAIRQRMAKLQRSPKITLLCSYGMTLEMRSG